MILISTYEYLPYSYINIYCKRIQAHSSKINAIQLNDDCTVCITASYDQTVKCWDLRSSSYEPIQVLQDFKDSVSCLSLKVDSCILTGCIDGHVRLYDMRKGNGYDDYA